MAPFLAFNCVVFVLNLCFISIVFSVAQQSEMLAEASRNISIDPPSLHSVTPVVMLDHIQSMAIYSLA